MLNIYDSENRHDEVLGVIVQFGGRSSPPTFLEEDGIRIIGTSSKNIELAEDRQNLGRLGRFQDAFWSV